MNQETKKKNYESCKIEILECSKEELLWAAEATAEEVLKLVARKKAE